MEEKLNTIIDLLEKLGGLTAPILICVILFFMKFLFRFISWFVDEMDKNDELKYLRLKKKYENEDHKENKK